MQKTGTELLTKALKEIKVLDPTATATDEMLADASEQSEFLLDEWRNDRLTISGVTISSQNLVSGQQSYTIGDGGNFNMEYPESIAAWSVIPDRTATDPNEIPMGRPLTADQWQGIRIKTQRGPYPTAMYFDGRFDAGLGHCLFYQIPDNSTVGVRLYVFVPDITTIDKDTTYNFAPGIGNALMLGLAVALITQYGTAAQPPADLQLRADRALMKAKRRNIRPKQSRLRGEWVIRSAAGRRNFNIYNGGR